MISYCIFEISWSASISVKVWGNFSLYIAIIGFVSLLYLFSLVLITFLLSSDLFSIFDLYIILSSILFSSNWKLTIKSKLISFFLIKEIKNSDWEIVLGYPSSIKPNLHSVLKSFSDMILFKILSETKLPEESIFFQQCWGIHSF